MHDSKLVSREWGPESLFDDLLARQYHKVLLDFFGAEDTSFQPSEIFVGKVIPDRIFKIRDLLVILELEVSVDSRVCAQLELQRAAAIDYYVRHVTYAREYPTKYQESLNRVKVFLFSVYHPSKDFEAILTKQGFRTYSIEHGVKSKKPLDYQKSPLPLVIADINAVLPEITAKNDIRRLHPLLNREFTIEEKLFLNRHKSVIVNILKYLESHNYNLEEVISIPEGELKQIVKEKLYLLGTKEIVEQLDIKELVQEIPIDELIKHVPIDELIKHVPIDELIKHLSFDEIISHVDFTKLSPGTIANIKKKLEVLNKK